MTESGATPERPPSLETHVISLTRAAARRAHVARSLGGRGIPFAFFDAIDKRDYTDEEVRRFVSEPRRGNRHFLPAGGICCTLSHLALYRRLAESRADAYLILEDDIEAAASAETVAEAGDWFLAQDRFDLVLVNSRAMDPIEVFHAEDATPTHGVYRCEGGWPMGSAGYFINREGAERIRAFNTPIRAPADTWGGFSRKAGVRVGVMKPDLFASVPFASDIGYTEGLRRIAARIAPDALKTAWRRHRYRQLERNVRRRPARQP